MGFSKSSAKGKAHSNTSLPQETTEKSNNLTIHIKKLEKEELENPRVSRRKEILKIRAEINAKDSMVLAQRQTYRSMEQNRKPRDKSTHIWTPYL